VADLPDVVIPVRPGDHNPELRWALRSLVNVPHGRVWIAGHMPSWVRDVRCIPTHQARSKYENSTRNVLAACRATGVAERFVLWNDDIFLLRPIDAVPVLHRGPVSKVIGYYESIASKAYLKGMRTTVDILNRLGCPDPLSYELHVPLPMTKSGFLYAHSAATAKGMPPTRVLHKRTLFGNVARIGGTETRDCKVFRIEQTWEPGDAMFVSTVDTLFKRHPAGDYVRDLYPDSGPYEASIRKPVKR
jgi:hypothetical protein